LGADKGKALNKISQLAGVLFNVLLSVVDMGKTVNTKSEFSQKEFKSYSQYHYQ
jgi:hypothetical protein